MIRYALNVVALLTGSYAALTWSLCLIDQAAIAGSVCCVALIAAELIRYCAQPIRRPSWPRHNTDDPASFALPAAGARWELPDFRWPEGECR